MRQEGSILHSGRGLLLAAAIASAISGCATSMTAVNTAQTMGKATVGAAKVTGKAAVATGKGAVKVATWPVRYVRKGSSETDQIRLESPTDAGETLTADGEASVGEKSTEGSSLASGKATDSSDVPAQTTISGQAKPDEIVTDLPELDVDAALAASGDDSGDQSRTR